MRILFINTLSYPDFIGGAERTVFELATELVKMYSAKVMILSTSPAGVKKDAVVEGVRVVTVPIDNIYHPYEGMVVKKRSAINKSIWHYNDRYSESSKLIVKDIVNKFEPDVACTNCLAGFTPSVWDALDEEGVPVVHVLRDYYLMCVKSSMFNNRSLKNCDSQCFTCRIYKNKARCITSKVSWVIGVSKFILNRHVQQKYFNSGVQKLSTIYNSVNIDESVVPERVKNEITKVGYLGQIIKEKGLDDVFEAYEKLNDNNLELHIFGKGSECYEKELKRRYQLNGVFWHGYTNVDKAFENIDILITPSLWHEPFGRVVVEAMSRGIPVIGSKRGGIREIIDNSGAGYLYDPQEPGRLCKLMEEVSGMSAESYSVMSSRAIQRAKDFSRENMTNEYWNVFSNVIKSQ